MKGRPRVAVADDLGWRGSWRFTREYVVEPELTLLFHKKFGYTSPMQVPRITKITLNMGVSEAVSDKKVMDSAVADLTKIAGQKPVVTKSKKAIAGFKIRENVPIGCMVTLRGVQMYEFLDRFVTPGVPHLHFDLYGWNPTSKPGRPEGGEAQTVRLLYALLEERAGR